MKTCSRCGQNKPLSEFSIEPRVRSGRSARCLQCQHEVQAAYRATPEGRAARRAAVAKYDASEYGRAMNKARRKTPEFRAARKLYEQTPEAAALSRIRRQRYLEKALATREGKLRWDAKLAVTHAVEHGDIPRVSSLFCSDCGALAVQYHHYLGYEKPYWLAVTPLCMACHTKRHS